MTTIIARRRRRHFQFQAEDINHPYCRQLRRYGWALAVLPEPAEPPADDVGALLTRVRDHLHTEGVTR